MGKNISLQGPDNTTALVLLNVTNTCKVLGQGQLHEPNVPAGANS